MTRPHRPRPARAAAGTVLVAVALLLAAAPAAAVDLGGHDRDGTVVGLEAGPGWTSIKFTSSGDETTLDPESAFAGGLNVGWAPRDELIGSIGIYGWKKSFIQDITPVSLTTFHFLAEVSWFPRGEGFWLKGGAGVGSLDLTATLPQQMVTYKKGGFSWTAGAGYELRVSDGTAIGLAYDFRWVQVGSFDFLEKTTVLTHAASFSLRLYM